MPNHRERERNRVSSARDEMPRQTAPGVGVVLVHGRTPLSAPPRLQSRSRPLRLARSRPAAPSPHDHGRRRLLRCLQGAGRPGPRPEAQGARAVIQWRANAARGAPGRTGGPPARARARPRLPAAQPQPKVPRGPTRLKPCALRSCEYIRPLPEARSGPPPLLLQAAVAALPRLATAVGAAAVLLTATPAFAGDLSLGQQVFDNK